MYLYSQLSPCGHLAITDTSLLRTPRYYGHLGIMDTLLLRTPRYYGHPAITDTSLLRTPRYYGHLGIRTGAKSPGKTTKKRMEITPAITELRTLYAVPNERFYCFTLVTTDTLDALNDTFFCLSAEVL